jgi:hypothetical protein
VVMGTVGLPGHFSVSIEPEEIDVARYVRRHVTKGIVTALQVAPKRETQATCTLAV